METHYKTLEKLFKTKSMPKCNEIVCSISDLWKTRVFKKYPDLKYCNSWLGKYAIQTVYIFSVVNFPYYLNDIEEKFKENNEISKKSTGEKKYSLPRRNKVSPEWDNVKTNKNVCLYVGSSDDFVQRLKEHLFLCNPDSYALHLEKWFPKDLVITIKAWNFQDFLKDVTPLDLQYEYLQNIEDLLWNHYQPLFGRQGKK